MSDTGENTASGWRTRGYLPHFDRPELVQFVTFRLLDAVPKPYLEQLRSELLLATDQERKRALQLQINQFLDTGYGSCMLGDFRIARLTQDALLHHNGSLCRMHAWVVMPNHVHGLVETIGNVALGTLVKSWKTFVVRQANNLLGRQGGFWHREYYDRYIRDGDHFERVLDYIHMNPVKAGLCVAPEDWQWSSIHEHAND